MGVGTAVTLPDVPSVRGALPELPVWLAPDWLAPGWVVPPWPVSTCVPPASLVLCAGDVWRDFAVSAGGTAQGCSSGMLVGVCADVTPGVVVAGIAGDGA